MYTACRTLPAHPPWLRAALVVAGIATVLCHQPVSGQGFGYEVAPVVTQLRWDGDLGIGNDYLYGGRLGLRFGPLVSLQGYYLTRSRVQLDPSVLTPVPDGVAIGPAREVDVRSVGANVTVNLGTSSTVPFVRAGAGVLRLQPDGVQTTDQIMLRAGGGLRFNISGGLGGEIFAEDWAFRVDRAQLFGEAVTPLDPQADRLRHNLAVGASLNVPIGGDVGDPGPGIRGASLPIEPFGGRLLFADEMALADQDVVGVRTGIDFNRFLGVRGFYWRGVTSAVTETAPIQGYGAEAQFNLGAGPGIFPYLVAGAGQIDFRPGYIGHTEVRPADQTALILGAGAAISLSDRVRVNVAVRDYLFSQGALEDVRRTDQLVHNPMLSAGMSFAVGGRPPVGPLLRQERERLSAEAERLRAENERLRQQIEAQQAERAEVRMEAEGIVAERPDQRTIVLPVPERGEIYIRFGEPGGIRIQGGSVEPSAAVSVESDPQALQAQELREVIREAVREEMQRQTGLPPATPAPSAATTPITGATAAAPTAEQRLAAIRAAVREEVQAQTQLQAATTPAAAAVPGATASEQLAATEAQITRRVEDIVNRRLVEQERRLAEQERRLTERERRLQAELNALHSRGTTVVVPTEVVPTERRVETVVPAAPPAAAPVVEAAPAGGEVLVVRERHRLSPQRTRLYTGLDFSGPTQLLLGGRVNLGPITPRSPFALVPSFAIGIGGQTSVLVAANLQVDAGPIGGRYAFEPHIGAGLGLLNTGGTEPVLNLGYGASALLGNTAFGPIRAFAEHQGIAMFGRHRLLAGVQVEF